MKNNKIDELLNREPKRKSCPSCFRGFYSVYFENEKEICTSCNDLMIQEKEKAEFLIMKNYFSYESYDLSLPYLDTDINHADFNLNLYNKIKKEWDSSKTWLGIVGEAGESKTRIACLLANKYFENVVFANSLNIKKASINQYSNNQGESDQACSFLRKLKNAKVLIIDDLGKGNLNKAYIDEIYLILGHRLDFNLVTIWTANTCPTLRFSDDICDDDITNALHRRCLENTHKFNVN